jgi:hypothetical protein
MPLTKSGSPHLVLLALPATLAVAPLNHVAPAHLEWDAAGDDRLKSHIRRLMEDWPEVQLAPLRLVSPKDLDYTASVVKQPLVNLEENVARVVGRRLRLPDPLSVRMSRKQDAVAWRRAFGGVKVPRGVYRFHTHQEADAWLWQMICRPSRS